MTISLVYLCLTEDLAFNYTNAIGAKWQLLA